MKDDKKAEQDEAPVIFEEFQALEMVSIDKEVATLQVIQRELDQQWSEESSKYEETVEREIQGSKRRMPRRNYYNPQGTVEDTSLFPYHDELYPLIDAYDWLYDDDDVEQEQHVEPGSLRPYKIPIARGDFREGHFPASPSAVAACLLEHLIPDGVVLLVCDELRIDGQNQMFDMVSEKFVEGRSPEEIRTDFGLEDPGDPNTLSKSQTSEILLKLLRHAASDLQRDYFLASSVLSRLSFEGHMENVDVLRRVLCILGAEFIPCELPCDEPEDHICEEWALVLERLRMALARGLSYVTDEHAITLVAFVRASYLNEFGHLIDESTSSDEPRAVEGKRKTLLKRTVVALRYVDRTESLQIPVQLIVHIIQSLGSRAWLERRRCRAAVAREDVAVSQLKRYLDSYWNCVRALVDIGNASIQILPPDSECFEAIASEIVKSLAYGFFEELTHVYHEREEDESTEALPEYLHETVRLPSLIDPRRYLEIVNATDRWKRLAAANKTIEGRGKSAVTAILDVVRPDEVRSVVRALFIQDFVHVRLSGLGYGDFLVWCGYEVHPLDPAIFWHEYQFPIDEDDSDDETEDEDDEYNLWDKDEAGHALSLDEIKARYHFTCMVLQRVWEAPWTPATHHSFQPEMQAAIRSFALCTHRLNLPNEIVERVASFLNREWWPDSRRECWSYECQVDQLARRKRPSKNKVCQPCSGCGSAWYCTKKCKDEDLKAGHKRTCGVLFGAKRSAEEEILYRKVFGDKLPPALAFGLAHSTEAAQSVASTTEMQPTDEEEDIVVLGEEGDDDGSWESMSSEDEEADDDEASQSSTTQAICQFFTSQARGQLL